MRKFREKAKIFSWNMKIIFSPIFCILFRELFALFFREIFALFFSRNFRIIFFCETIFPFRWKPYFRPIRLVNFAQYALPMLHLLKFYCRIYQAGCWDLTNFNLISLFKYCMEGYQKYLKYPVSSNIQTKIFP